MAIITLSTTFVDGTVPTAAQFNGNFTTIVNEINGALSNTNIASDAAIAATKISGTAATLSGTQSFTGVNTFTGAIKQTMTTDTDGGTVTFDLNVTNAHEVTLAGNRTLAISNETAGQFFAIKLIQDGTGSRTVTWFSTIKWAGGSAPTLTTTASKSDLFVFLVTGTDTYDGFIAGQNI